MIRPGLKYLSSPNRYRVTFEQVVNVVSKCGAQYGCNDCPDLIKCREKFDMKAIEKTTLCLNCNKEVPARSAKRKCCILCGELL